MIDRSSAWRALDAHRAELQGFSLRAAFDRDSGRFANHSLSFRDTGVELLADWSKQRIDERTLPKLVDLANACGLRSRIDAMFDGAVVNPTERRAALHVALRDLTPDPSRRAGGASIGREVEAVRERMLDFAERVRAGGWRGHRGDRITDVVNLGIGGSDLGPQMIVSALEPQRDGPRVHFVSNVDATHLALTLRELDPARTLFVIASKTFTTIETMTNARTARAWTIAGLTDESAIARHFVAVSTNAQAVAAFGIGTAQMFGFWDWVGGRYSLWSSVGLPIALAVGRSGFMELLTGAHAMDRHFRSAPFDRNLPVVLALLRLWNRHWWGAHTHCIAPYYQPLARFVAHIQQLDMESNGKRVDIDGRPVSSATGAVVWGEPGTNGQHAFFQLLHQGTDAIPVDFLVAAQSPVGHDEHQAILLANCLAQSEALMRGRTADEARAQMLAAGISHDDAERLAPHRAFPGDRPSTTLLVRRFDPATLGALVALYEHQVVVQAAVWNINPFDQWGVELGKQLATQLAPVLEGGGRAGDASTQGLVDAIRALQSSHDDPGTAMR